MLKEQLQEIKNNKICRFVDSSELYPDRENVLITTPKAPEYKKVMDSKKRLLVFKKKTGYSYKYSPSESYNKMLQHSNNCIFHIKKRMLLSDVSFLDSILNKIWHLQKD